MECGHLCGCSAMALLSWALCWALGSTGAEQQDWGSGGEQEDVFKIHHLHPFPFGSPRNSKASGFVQLAEQSHDPSESEIIKEGKLGAYVGSGGEEEDLELVRWVKPLVLAEIRQRRSLI